MDNLVGLFENVGMAERKRRPDFGYVNGQRPPHFIGHWRSYRKRTQDPIAQAAGMTANNLSQLETYTQGWSADGLVQLAEALGTNPGALLMINPLMPGEVELWETWLGADDEERAFLGEMAPLLLRRRKRGEIDDDRTVRAKTHTYALSTKDRGIAAERQRQPTHGRPEHAGRRRS